MPVYNEKYIKAKQTLKKLKTNFLGDEIPKENEHYACTACVTIVSVMTMKKKNYPQVYLEEGKYKIKKIKMPEFMNTELESESELESDTELGPKPKIKSDFE